MRRRALLAASQTGGGSKIRNVIRAKWSSKPAFASLYELSFIAEYPVSSTINIGISNGNNVAISAGETYNLTYGSKDAITVIGLSFVKSPPYESQIEDDTYIYELEVI